MNRRYDTRHTRYARTARPGRPTRAFIVNDPFAPSPEGPSRGVAAILAVTLGPLGAHYFYVGKTAGALLMIVLTLLTCGTLSTIISMIQVVSLLTMTNTRFRHDYIQSAIPTPL